MTTFEVLRLETNGSRTLLGGFATEPDAEAELAAINAAWDEGAGCWVDDTGARYVIDKAVG